jgi:hypothetical protein
MILRLYDQSRHLHLRQDIRPVIFSDCCYIKANCCLLPKNITSFYDSMWLSTKRFCENRLILE